MGMSDYTQEDERRGYKIYPVRNKYICMNCISDPSVKKAISTNLESKFCSYCGKKGQKNLIASKMDIVVKEIFDAINYEWDEAGSYIPYTTEDGWIGEKISTYDILVNEIIPQLGCCQNSEIFKDLHACMDDKAYCKKGGYNNTADNLRYSWKTFKDIVKHKVRFVFFKNNKFIKDLINYDNQVYPEKILDVICHFINNQSMITTIDKNTTLYRCRDFKEKRELKKLGKNELGQPSARDASSGRMNPVGISVFYGALEVDTAYKEILAVEEDSKYYYVGGFVSLKPLNLLNLCNLPITPSIFNIKKREHREPIEFLYEFVKDVCKPIDKNKEQEHIDYIPTQIVSEYFKYFLKVKDKKKINGILYPSSKSDEGKCCVLFINQDNLINKTDPLTPQSLLKLKKVIDKSFDEGEVD